MDGSKPLSPPQTLRRDLQVIAEMIAPGVRVLDIGCGDGALLAHLWHAKGVDARGIELSQAGVNECVARGLSVVQGNADTDLAEYPAQAFDYAILSETLQATRNPKTVLLQLVRIARHAVVSFTNVGHWRFRLSLLATGRMPAIRSLGNSQNGVHWYDSHNIHLCTIRDFAELCFELELAVEQAVSINRAGKVRELNTTGHFANLVGEQGIFLLTRK